MEKRFSIDEIDKLGVYELRELARRLGIASPTTKKSKQLKEEISKIYLGEVKIEISDKKRLGRPPKSISFADNDATNFLIPKDVYEIAQNQKKSVSNEELILKNLIFKYDAVNVQELSESINKQVFGYLKKTEQNHFYFWLQENMYFSKEILVYVPDNFVQKYKFRVGDKLDALVTVYSNNNYGIICQVNKINNVDVEKTIRQNNYVEKMFTYPKVNIPLTKKDCVLEGGRALRVFDNRTQMALDTIDYAIEVAETVKVVYVACEVSVEHCNRLADSQKVEVFASRFGDSLDSSYDAIANAISYAQSLAIDNNRVVIMIYDIINMLEVLQLYFESKGGHKSSGTQMIKSIYGLGKCYGENSSITTIAALNKNEFWSEFVQKELTKVSSCVAGDY